MCLAVPLKLIEKTGAEGIGEFDGINRRIRLDFVPQAELGDYVLVHAGFAIEKVRREQAEEERKAFREVVHAL